MGQRLLRSARSIMPAFFCILLFFPSTTGPRFPALLPFFLMPRCHRSLPARPASAQPAQAVLIKAQHHKAFLLLYSSSLYGVMFAAVAHSTKRERERETLALYIPILLSFSPERIWHFVCILK